MIKIKEGMILSNEPGYYKKNKFGIRIENLIRVKRDRNNLKFENLTLVPIDKSLIEKKLLNKQEEKWLNDYHQNVFINLKKFMSKKEVFDLRESCSNIYLYHSTSDIILIFISFALSIFFFVGLNPPQPNNQVFLILNKNFATIIFGYRFSLRSTYFIKSSSEHYCFI